MKSQRRSRCSLLAYAACAALVFASFAACSSNAEAPEERPRESPAGSWTLAELPAAPDVDLDAAQPPPSLVVTDDGGASGHSGVNTFHGQFDPAALADGRLQAGPMMSTRMAGPPAAMALEHAFLQALSDADAFRFEAGQLVLTRAGQPVARFAPAAP